MKFFPSLFEKRANPQDGLGELLRQRIREEVGLNGLELITNGPAQSLGQYPRVERPGAETILT